MNDTTGQLIRALAKTFLLFLLALLPSLATGAVETAPPLTQGAEMELPLPLGDEVPKNNGFEYVLEGRPDPFKPFISETATTVPTGPDKILEPEGELTGMQLFEPGQLTLVAIVMGETYDFAMVEDTIGKGYVIKEGTKIGKRGKVASIEANRVLIEEIAYTRSGKQLTSNVVMLLKKEGEE
jgi:Tfp pilus assembly protein PilP